MSNQSSINQDLFEALMVEVLPKLTISAGKYSVSVVNNVNGKRVTISKALAERLELSDSVSMMPFAEGRKLVIGQTLPFPHAAEVTLSDGGKKIAYNAQLVEILTKAFALDFSKRTSRSFDDITFDQLKGVPVAIVTIP